jgi:hypothetical protein
MPPPMTPCLRASKTRHVTPVLSSLVSLLDQPGADSADDTVVITGPARA